jgi:hypothetical protein
VLQSLHQPLSCTLRVEFVEAIIPQTLVLHTGLKNAMPITTIL